MTHGCDSMAPLLTQWADDELGRAERQAVDEHIAHCAACRGRAMRERAVRELVHARADTLRGSAPDGLRARVRRRPARVIPMEARRAVRRPAWRLPLAASLLLGVIGAGLFGALAPSGSLLAAQLTLDHLKCGFLAHDERGISPATLEARWEAQQGWAIHVPAPDLARGLRLVGLRRCLFSGGTMAHVLYDYRGHALSLFVLRGPRQADAALAIMGYGTRTWSAGQHTLALVGHVPRDNLAGVASLFERQDGERPLGH